MIPYLLLIDSQTMGYLVKTDWNYKANVAIAETDVPEHKNH